MRAIALWSRHHILAARALIGISHIIIFCLAYYVGAELQKNSIFISPTVFWLFGALFLVVNFSFSSSYASFSFYKRKLLDGLILVSSFIMIVSFANHDKGHYFIFYKTVRGSFTEKKNKPGENKPIASVKELKKQLKELRAMAKKGGGASAGGIVLAILVAAGLGILLSGAVCSLSCNGHDALAVMLLIGGVTAIFFICKLILSGTRKKDSINMKPG
jgi:uncharacterized membrane protein YbhN (UPF0104 family)